MGRRRPRPAWRTEPGGPSAWQDMGPVRWWLLAAGAAAGLATGHWLPLVAVATGLLAAARLIDAASGRRR